jgi:hypothetical protein
MLPGGPTMADGHPVVEIGRVEYGWANVTIRIGY